MKVDIQIKRVLTILVTTTLCNACGHSRQAIHDLKKEPNDFIGRYYEASAGEDIPGFAKPDTALASDYFLSTGTIEKKSKLSLSDLRALNTNLNTSNSRESANSPLLVKIIGWKTNDAQSTALQLEMLNKKYFSQKSWVSATVLFEHSNEIPSPFSVPAKTVRKYNQFADLKQLLSKKREVSATEAAER